MNNHFNDIEYKRILWACKRGMLEVDLILMRFVETSYFLLNAQEKEDFKLLLTQSDTDLYRWLLGYEICNNSQISYLIKKIMQDIKEEKN